MFRTLPDDVLAVRKTSNQTAHYTRAAEDRGALGRVFEATLCGRTMVLGHWAEVHDGTGWSQVIGHGPAFLLQPCTRCTAKLDQS
jgi:hypothetical protein